MQWFASTRRVDRLILATLAARLCRASPTKQRRKKFSGKEGEQNSLLPFSISCFFPLRSKKRFVLAPEMKRGWVSNLTEIVISAALFRQELPRCVAVGQSERESK